MDFAHPVALNPPTMRCCSRSSVSCILSLMSEQLVPAITVTSKAVVKQCSLCGLTGVAPLAFTHPYDLVVPHACYLPWESFMKIRGLSN